MQLLFSPSSPFVRKVLLVAAVKGLSDKLKERKTDTTSNDPELARVNPLGKIPALALDDGTTIYDSQVICEYLDSLAPSPKLFPDGAARWPALTLGALADGILEAALLMVYEGRYRPEGMRVQAWVDRQQSKIDRALAYLEAKGAPAGIDYGTITLACALGYLDFRHGGKWRAGHPKLVAWLDAFAAKVPAFDASKPSG
ncbi:MAG: glutathione S-transferase [Hyphomicrobiaceae bacterium]|nr:glutathione S-transferase [Hyphomicrobiaceae bacterium]